MPITLPTKANVPSDKLGDYTILFAGVKKIGKTSIAAQFPNSFVLEHEVGNAAALPIRQLDSANWETTIQIVSLLESQPNYCQTLVVDDVPAMYRYCMAAVARKRGFEHPSDWAYGKGWEAVESEFLRIITRIQALKVGKIYTCHTQIREVETRSGKKIARLETSMGTQADRAMEALSQLWGVMDYEGEKRYLTIVGNEFVKAGNSLNKHFIDATTKKPLTKIFLGNSPEEGYKNIVTAFANQYSEPSQQKQQQTQQTQQKPQQVQQKPQQIQQKPVVKK